MGPNRYILISFIEMISIDDREFHTLVEQAVAAIPERYKSHLDNVAFLVAADPTAEQMTTGGQLHGDELLLGLYEGIPLPERNDGYSGVLPDVITVFRRPHLMVAHDRAALEQLVHETVWHEVAHYFGLDHGQIRALES